MNHLLYDAVAAAASKVDKKKLAQGVAAAVSKVDKRKAAQGLQPSPPHWPTDKRIRA